MNDRIDEVAVAADGTQLDRSVKKLRALRQQVIDRLNQIPGEVQAALTALGVYTKAETDAKVATPGDIAPANVTASGAGKFPAGLNSADVYSRSVTYGGSYSATWTHQDGTMGTAPSSRRFKRDIVPATLDITALERAEIVQFRYLDAVENLGDGAETRLGGIAEQFVEAGLGHAVTFDEDGLPFSIEDRPLLYTLLAGYQQLAREVAELRADR